MKNKYGKVSGGYIYDMLDKTAHNIAVNTIGECVTASGNISYFNEVENEEEIKIVTKNKNKITDGKVYIEMEAYIYNYYTIALATFVFIKKKN